MQRENLFVLHEDQKVHLAINRLGLTTLSPFNAKLALDNCQSFATKTKAGIISFQGKNHRVLLARC